MIKETKRGKAELAKSEQGDLHSYFGLQARPIQNITRGLMHCLLLLCCAGIAVSQEPGPMPSVVGTTPKASLTTKLQTTATTAEKSTTDKTDAGNQMAIQLDQQIIKAAATDSQILKNLTTLCDEIGPRLTGSASLKRANDWAAEKMKEYGLSNVHHEAWEMPEGWERGIANMKIISPGNGRSLTVASYAWRPGTKGKIEAEVIALKVDSQDDIKKYEGKLKGKVILARPPSRVPSLKEIDSPLEKSFNFAPKGKTPNFQQMRALMQQMNDMMVKEQVAALIIDSGKPLGLLNMTGSWGNSRDRASASNQTPMLFMAHNHYELLYRLASRPGNAVTKVELEVSNKFIEGPIPVYNTIGEIPGTDKADEVVVVGAHLDSWDLGQGATDNGTGSNVVLETARILKKLNIKPRRTIRFILFTGEEQGLHGSRNYVEKHKDEMAKVTACLVHDTGTGRIKGIDSRHRPGLQPILKDQLVSLKDLNAFEFDSAFIGGSDHASFDRVGVPGLMFRQESAGYFLSHHSQADTVDRALEKDLIQGVQVMGLTAVRLANMESMLPREKVESKKDRKKGLSKSAPKKVAE